MACSLSIMLARSRLSATGTACVPPLTSLCYPPTIIRAFCVCDPHVMRSSKTNHKPADMQQAYPEANTELVEQVSKMTSKHEKEREREGQDVARQPEERIPPLWSSCDPWCEQIFYFWQDNRFWLRRVCESEKRRTDFEGVSMNDAGNRRRA